MMQVHTDPGMVGVLPFDQDKYGFKGMLIVPYGQMQHPEHGLVDLIRMPEEDAHCGWYGEQAGVASSFFPNGARPNRDKEWGHQDPTGRRDRGSHC